MKILIVDDQANRYRKLIDSLYTLGVSRNDIDLSVCTHEARLKLELNCYELLILDLLIPRMPEDEPDEINSQDLLNDLSFSDEYKKPKKIIGITADKEGLNDTVSQFEMLTWQVVKYEQSCTSWITQIEHCIKYLTGHQYNHQPVEHDVDVAIICALDNPELSEVLALDWGWSTPIPIDDNTFIYEGVVKLKNKQLKVCAAHCSRMGMVATANKASSIINTLHPKVVVMTGICGGIKKHTNFGDVIFAESVWDYQSGKLKNEEGKSVFEISPHQLTASTDIRSKFELLKADNKAIGQISLDYNEHVNVNPRLLLGPIATGAAVVADPNYVDDIVSQNRKVLGIEMEIYGLYAAVENANHPKPKVFALKSVCDFADAEKDDDYQRYCSYMSANVLRVFLEKFGENYI